MSARKSSMTQTKTYKDSYGDRDWSIGVTGGDRDIDGLPRLTQEGEAGRLGTGGEGSTD